MNSPKQPVCPHCRQPIEQVAPKISPDVWLCEEHGWVCPDDADDDPARPPRNGERLDRDAW